MGFAPVNERLLLLLPIFGHTHPSPPPPKKGRPKKGEKGDRIVTEVFTQVFLPPRPPPLVVVSTGFECVNTCRCCTLYLALIFLGEGVLVVSF